MNFIIYFYSFYNKLYEPPSLKLNILHRMMPRKLLKAPIHIQVLLISLEKLLLLQLLSSLTTLYTNTLLLNILYITFNFGIVSAISFSNFTSRIIIRITNPANYCYRCGYSFKLLMIIPPISYKSLVTVSSYHLQ